MFTLDQVVPWGRSFDEYQRMFALTDADLRLKILGCADGPASFNAEATRRGVRVISADPLYRFTTEIIRDRISATYYRIMEQTKQNTHQFVWDGFGSLDDLGRTRMQAMQAFLDDMNPERAKDDTLTPGSLGCPFPDPFHQRAIVELCRVSPEIRIFPLLALDGRRSPHVASVAQQLGEVYEVSVERVPYEFQRGGNEMMRIRVRNPKPSGAAPT